MVEIRLERRDGIWWMQPQGELTIYGALEAKEELLAALEEAPALELDLTLVSEMDTAGLQVLLLAAREALRQEKGFAVGEMSPAAEELLTLGGLGARAGLLSEPRPAGEPAGKEVAS